MKFLLPLGVFAVLSGFLFSGLNRDPRYIPSPLVDRAAPPFRLALLREPERTFAPSEMHGKVWLLNVWASWCVSCRAEHEILKAVSRSGVVGVYGLDYKDERSAALAFLDQFGDPYALTMVDPDGRVGIDYGVYGVPETYVIDRDGVIRYKQIGALSVDVLEQTVLPLVARLKR